MCQVRRSLLAALWLPTIMPHFMPRPRPLWLLIALLGGFTPAAWAEDPPCPTQVPAPAAKTAPAATGTKTPAGAKKRLPVTPVAGGDIDITSDAGTLGVDGTATLRGNVQMHQGDREIRANEVQYSPQNQSVKTDGHIDYNDPQLHVSGEGGGSYSSAAGADFKSAHFDLHQRAARGTATDMSVTPAGVVSLKGVTFTTCPVHDEAWQIKADSIVLDTRSQVGTGRDAQIDFMGVPLVYLPWLSFPLGNERKSGFLFPTIGNTSSSGLQLSDPYYWNIAPNADFTFEPTVYSKRGADLGGDLRFLTQDQHGELQWNFLPDDTVFGGSRSRLQLNEVAELPDDLRLTIDAQHVSDLLYFQNFSATPEGTSTAFLEQRATLSYRDDHWSVDAQAQQYQTIDDTLPVDESPYARAPWLAVGSAYTFDDIVHYGFDSEIVDFRLSDGPTGPTGWRGDFTPAVSLDLTGPGYFMRPALAWRLTQYELADLLPGEASSPSRSLPIASLDTGLVFERQTGSRDQRTLTLEPRLLYLDVPYRNQDQLPVFDTAVPDLTPVELFSTNRYVGADRVSDANQMSLGVTSRLLDAQDGRQFLAATLGQTYYFEIPRVTLPGETPITARHSDFVGQLALTAFQDWSAGMGVQWDPQNERSERTQINLQYKPAADEVINLAYRYERFVQELVVDGVPVPSPCAPNAVQNAIQTAAQYPVTLMRPIGQTFCDSQGFDQVDLSGAWPVKGNWNVFFRDVYSIRDNKELEQFAGFEYRSCCWRLRLGARRYVSTFTGAEDTGIWLQLELAGLAGVGSASDTSLSEEIRGYTPADATSQRIGTP
jgi:LPS-assembly protein